MPFSVRYVFFDAMSCKHKALYTMCCTCLTKLTTKHMTTWRNIMNLVKKPTSNEKIRNKRDRYLKKKKSQEEQLTPEIDSFPS